MTSDSEQTSGAHVRCSAVVSLRFGDILINHWASVGNPLRRGIFVRANKGTCLMTDGHGDFWETATQDARLEKVGSVIAQANDRTETPPTSGVCKP